MKSQVRPSCISKLNWGGPKRIWLRRLPWESWQKWSSRIRWRSMGLLKIHRRTIRTNSIAIDPVWCSRIIRTVIRQQILSVPFVNKLWARVEVSIQTTRILRQILLPKRDPFRLKSWANWAEPVLWAVLAWIFQVGLEREVAPPKMSWNCTNSAWVSCLKWPNAWTN